MGLLSTIWNVVIETPRKAKLTYCLLRDERVPTPPKVALLAALGIIVSPIDFPAWVPLLGELDMFALGVIAVESFIAACPRAIVAEHQEALRDRTSLYHRDLYRTRIAARQGMRRLAEGIRNRRRGGVETFRELEGSPRNRRFRGEKAI